MATRLHRPAHEQRHVTDAASHRASAARAASSSGGRRRRHCLRRERGAAPRDRARPPRAPALRVESGPSMRTPSSGSAPARRRRHPRGPEKPPMRARRPSASAPAHVRAGARSTVPRQPRGRPPPPPGRMRYRAPPGSPIAPRADRSEHAKRARRSFSAASAPATRGPSARPLEIHEKHIIPLCAAAMAATRRAQATHIGGALAARRRAGTAPRANGWPTDTSSVKRSSPFGAGHLRLKALVKRAALSARSSIFAARIARP